MKLSQPGASLQPTSETWLDTMSNRLENEREKFQPLGCPLLKVFCVKTEHLNEVNFDGAQVPLLITLRPAFCV